MKTSKQKIHQEIQKNVQEFHETAQSVKEGIEENRREIQHESFSSAIHKLFSLTEDVASHDEIRDRILGGGKLSGTNMCVLMLAILIASVGLNTNSTAVIIGAMLISPLMGSILATAYGTVSADAKTAGIHGVGFLLQIAIALITSTLYFALSPLKTQTAELLARTQPTFFDVIIAVCGGLAGIIGQTRKDKANNIIPGVAIATALMPPLCTCGYAIANGKWRMLSGASYLFLVNSYFIFCSAAIVLSLLRIPKVRDVSEAEWKKLRKRMIRNAVLITIPSIVLAVLMVMEQGG